MCERAGKAAGHLTDETPQLHYLDFDETGVTGAGELNLAGMPDDIRERIEQGWRDGVTYSVDLHAGTRPHTVTAIHWRLGPGPYAVPNVLAESIIKHVHGAMEIELDGHRYVIRPAGVKHRKGNADR